MPYHKKQGKPLHTILAQYLQISTSGAHFGKSELVDASIIFRDTRDAPLLAVPLERASLCVVPTNNRDEVEIQFSEGASGAAKEDVLVQMTLHFPSAGREERERDESSLAQQFHQQILGAGVIQSVTGEVIVEFGKEQGSFVAPRGKYALQMASSYFYMQGAQYAYKIPYEDISSLFLLPKLDAGRFAFVIALDKPVKQGQQRYSFLVMDSHSLEHTAHLTLSEAQLEQYDGQLQAEMTMSLCNLIAKVFKVLSNKKVDRAQELAIYLFILLHIHYLFILIYILILYMYTYTYTNACTYSRCARCPHIYTHTPIQIRTHYIHYHDTYPL
ncbi:hypothetical protein EON64_13035 [archaeon]|nr:MAG: hypothetical protein EON64_13035 [archaeon]